MERWSFIDGDADCEPLGVSAKPVFLASSHHTCGELRGVVSNGRYH
jgi:hypothetical protein